MALDIHSTLTLNNGVQIPRLGLGVFRSPEGQVTRDAVRDAFRAGYRHIDTARIYGNERDVGSAVRESGLPRGEVFVTTKLWNSDHGYDAALRAFDASMERLGLDYVDLYLIHWPVAGPRRETWRAMAQIAKSGRCRAVGVSNYMVRHLAELVDHTDVIPAVNQVEFSPYLYLSDLLTYCTKHGIALEAYSPLTKGQKLRDPRLVEIAGRYKKTAAQVLIRWCLQKDTVVIPKSVRRERIEENAAVFDFEISAEDMARLDGFHENLHTGWDPTDAP